MQGSLQPVFLLSPRYRNEVAAAIESSGRPVVAARRMSDVEQRFIECGAEVAVVDGRGAAELGLQVLRVLAPSVEAMGGALIILLSRGDSSYLNEAYEAGATAFLISPFGATELGQVLRFAERYVRRVSLGQTRTKQRSGDMQADARIASWHIDLASRNVTISHSLGRMLQLPVQQRRSKLNAGWRALGYEGRKALRDAVRRMLDNGLATSFSHEVERGRRFHRLVHHLFIERDRNGEVTGLGATVEDLEQARAERRAATHFDQLTRLANASSFRKWVNARLVDTAPYDPAVIMILVAVSRFDEINAAYGRHVGDALLEAVGRRVNRLVEDDDDKTVIVSRLGGAEFAIALSGPVTLSEASFLAERVGASFDRPFLCQGHLVHLSCRMGIAVGEASVENADVVLRRASAALSVAKDQEPNSYQIYVGDAEVDAFQARAELESDLRRAMAEGEIVVHYQPQVDIASNRIIGVEALTRWNHPRLGILSAETLLSVAGRAEIFPLLSQHILEQTLTVVKSWPIALSHLRVSVNVAATELDDLDFPRKINERVVASGVDRGRITLEVTESGLIKNLEYTANMLADLRALGFRIAIDDFGTGYSSLAYLKALPLDFLKLDKRLVDDMVGSPRDKVVVSSVIEMARSLDLGVVAEGVEVEMQLSMLARAGCTTYQGFLCAPPLISSELIAFVTRWNTPHTS